MEPTSKHHGETMKRLLLSLIILLLWSPSVWGACSDQGSQVYHCTSVADLNTQVASAVKGDKIILMNSGSPYSDAGFSINTSGLEGGANEPAETLPVIIKAETPGSVVITGNTHSMRGTYTYLHGLDLTTSSGSGVFFTMVDCYKCRVTNNRFLNIDRAGGTVEVKGTDGDTNPVGPSTDNRFDHNTFHNTADITIENFIVDKSTWQDLGNIRNTYDHNVFRDYCTGGGVAKKKQCRLVGDRPCMVHQGGILLSLQQMPIS